MEDKEKEFAQIVKEHKRRIYTVCYMFSKDADEVADLFQEILINMWKGFSSFRGDSSVSTWIWRISLNTCINTSKKSRRSETIPLNVSINPYEDIDEEALQVRQLYDRINRLGLVDRSIILLWLENMTYEEIGAIMGISVKNVSIKLVRIKEKLKQMSNNK
jgi:RNA polymerase sigma-70 factor (ECF subfamily)